MEELIEFQDGDFGSIKKTTPFQAKTYLRLFKPAPDLSVAEPTERPCAQERQECGICRGGESSKHNLITCCDGRGCQVLIHVHCRSTAGRSDWAGGDRRWYCDPCADGVLIHEGMRGVKCSRCDNKSLSEPFIQVNTVWQHNQCFHIKKKTKKTPTAEQPEKKSRAAPDQATFETGGEDQDRRKRDKECWSVIYRALEAVCLVCEDYKKISNQPGRFQKAHIDPTRKHDAGNDSWNTVPSCECNQMYGSMNMFDFMAGKTITRGNIKEIAGKKLFAHLRNGFSTGPKVDDYVKFFRHGEFDFASMVENVYNCQKMRDESCGYAGLLTLSPDQDKIFRSLLTRDPAPYKHSDWEPSSI